jgi:hypothetical protein
LPPQSPRLAQEGLLSEDVADRFGSVVGALAAGRGMPLGGSAAFAHLSHTLTSATRAVYSHAHQRPQDVVVPGEPETLLAVTRRLVYSYVCADVRPTEPPAPGRPASPAPAAALVPRSVSPLGVVRPRADSHAEVPLPTRVWDFDLAEGDRGVYVVGFPAQAGPSVFGGLHAEISLGDIVARVNGQDATELTVRSVGAGEFVCGGGGGGGGGDGGGGGGGVWGVCECGVPTTLSLALAGGSSAASAGGDRRPGGDLLPPPQPCRVGGEGAGPARQPGTPGCRR